MNHDPDLPELDDEALARAEAALARLASNYLAWADADAATLSACLDMLAKPDADLAALLPRLFAISHNMKGQGATFGYPLVSELGNRLCRLMEGEPQPGPEARGRMLRLGRAMVRVVSERLEGEGGKTGKDLLAL